MAMLVHDKRAHRLLAVNQAAMQLYDYERGTMLNMSVRDLRHPDDSARLRDLLGQSAQNDFHSGVWRHQRRDGSTVIVESSAQKIIFQDKPACLLVLRDVTLERRAIR